jgi:hypothetical protein
MDSMSVMFASPALPEGTVLAVSAPGGMARHFRVQIQVDQHPDEWHLHATFRNLTEAQACLRGLLGQGLPARVVGYQTLPTAG